jgi:hypothetical protein
MLEPNSLHIGYNGDEGNIFMKSKKLLLFVLVLVLISLSCKVFTPNLSNDPSNRPNNSANLPVVDFVTPAEPLNVTVQLDELYTVSGPISVNGGSMVLTGADGTLFTLDVPAKALDVDTVITMTAVKNITGAPLGSDAVSAVQLEPSGLFFNELVTLTIVPGKEIPIKEQIIFGYEGAGQDYHLAVIDPKSKDIKIKLMEFSGAGVGSGPESAWAANLQIQGNATRARIDQKLGELLQVERQAQLLGMDGNPDIWKIVKSDMDQYYDQVIQKEMAAAELDCQYAMKAAHDLLALERQNQLLGINADDANGNAIPIVPGLWEKIDKLSKIYADCKKVYNVSGESNHVSFTGKICGLDKPFVIDATFPGGGSAKTTFTPNTVVEGTTSVTGGGTDCVQTGEGKYSVSISEDGNGTLQWTTTDTLTCPDISNTQTGSFTLPLQLAPGLSCP